MSNRETARVMLAMLKAELEEKAISEELTAEITEELVQELYRLSKFHDLAHIVGNALLRVGKLQGVAMEKFRKRQYLAMYRYQRILYELESVKAILVEAKIPYMPLKGTVLREFYPDPAMRTSCDIDILIHPEDLERAKTLLMEKLSYTLHVEGPHDVGLYTPSDLHVELHYALCDEDDKRTLGLGDPWEHSCQKEGSPFEYEMTNEFFYAYAMAHAAKHFYIGGCGIRPFMDMLVMKEHMPYDQKTVDEMLEKTDLGPFAFYAERLAACWFAGGERDDMVDAMEDFILEGGTYGSMEGYIVSIQGDKSGFYYLIRKIFLPYSGMVLQFPVLKKCPILLPFCHVIRWFTVIFKRRKEAMIQVRASQKLDRKKAARVVALQKKLNLD